MKSYKEFLLNPNTVSEATSLHVENDVRRFKRSFAKAKTVEGKLGVIFDVQMRLLAGMSADR